MDRDMIATMAMFAAAVIGIVGVVRTVEFYVDRSECSYTQENSGLDTKFVKNHPLSWDCYVRVDGGWVTVDKWRGDED